MVRNLLNKYFNLLIFKNLVVLAVFTFAVKCMSVYVQRTDTPDSKPNDAAFLSEEEEYQFDRIWSSDTFRFLLPVPSQLWLPSFLFQSLVNGAIFFGAYFYLLPSNIQARYSIWLMSYVVNCFVASLGCQSLFSKCLDG